MNSSIDSLNLWGARFLDFAVPMLWQSCLLIAVVFALDILLRRKIRAAIRYSLWFVVFVKLLVPPTLALPTSAAWWLRGRPAPPPPPQKRVLTVQYTDEVSDYVPPVMQTTVYTPPPPQLSREGWILLSAMAVSGLLAAWLVLRWGHVARCVRRTTSASAEISDMLAQACRQVNLRRNVKLRVTSEAMSPAVCGLFRPVILLPQSLIKKLTPNQLRAVLLHELIHLRRRDVWANCAQTLLQIVYWWNPLLWLANARVRRVREEAVDDAVMCALQAEAEIYAPTLLEVAKLAFNRPLASLGLVGILESRNALRNRIERLLNFATPRRAGVSVVSVICLAAFTALAVPMGEPPARPAKATLVSDSETLDAGSEKLILFHAKVNPEVFRRNVMARAGETMHTTNDDWNEILVSVMDEYGVDCTGEHAITFNQATGEVTARNTSEADGVMDEVVRELNLTGGERILNPPHGLKEALIEVQLYKIRPEDMAKFQLNAQSLHRGGALTPWWGLSSADLANARAHLKDSGIQPMSSPRIQTFHGVQAGLFVGDGTDDVRVECVPYVHGGSVDLTVLARTTGTYAPEGKSWPDVDGHTNCAIFSRVSIPDGGGAALVAEPIGSTQRLLVLIKAKIIDPGAKTGAAGTRTNTGLRKAPDAATLVNDGKLLYQLGKLDEAEAKFQKVLEMDPNNQAAQYYWTLLKQARARQIADTNVKSGAHNVPGPDGPPINKPMEQARQKVFQKLNEITFDTISYSDVSLEKVVRDLKARSIERDPDHKGMGFGISLSLAPGWADRTTAVNPGLPSDEDWTSIKVNLTSLKNVSLLDVLEAINKSADYPLTYFVLSDGVVFSLGTPGATPFLASSAKRQELYQKLNEIKFDKVSYANLPLSEVIKNLAEQSKRRDPEEEGINFLLNKSLSSSFDPRTGAPIPLPDVDLASVKINLDRKDISLIDLLSLIAEHADHPIRYYFMDYGIEFSLHDTNAPELHTRTFRIDAQKFFQKYPMDASISGTNAASAKAIQQAFLKFCNEAGVNLALPKSVFFNDRQGTLTVRATDGDLERIESALSKGELSAPATPAIGEAAVLHTRMYKLDVNTFFLALQKKGVIPMETNGVVSTPTAPSGQRSLQVVVTDNEQSAFRMNVQNGLMAYFKAHSVDLQAPKNIFYNDRNSTLTVRATEKELATVEHLIDVLNSGAAPDGDAAKLDESLLHTHTFKVDPNAFLHGLVAAGVFTNRAPYTDTPELQRAVAEFFRKEGVNLSAPKTISYRRKDGVLTVQTTADDFDSIQKVIAPLTKPLPEVTVKARFVETDKQFLKMLSTNGVATPTNGAPNRILTEEQFKSILKALEKRNHANLLNEGEVTTLSGHQAQFQVVDVLTMVYGATNKTPPYDTKEVPFGTTLDVSSQVAADGHTIQLHAIPSVTEFLGYQDAKTGKLLKAFDSTRTVAFPTSRIRQTTTDTIISDGDTLMLGDLGDEWVTEKQNGTVERKPFDNKSDKRLVVFVTTTVIDGSGNRVNGGNKVASTKPR